MDDLDRIVLIRRLLNHAQRNLGSAIREAELVVDWPRRDVDRLDVTMEYVNEATQRLCKTWKAL